MIKWNKLYIAVDKRRKELDISWRELGRINNISSSAFTRISQGKPLSAENLQKIQKIIDPKYSIDVYYK